MPLVSSAPCRKSREVLQWLAVNPQIKVIHNTRNMLDVAVSRYKHNTYDGLNSHCKTEECAANHTVSHIVVPIDELLSTLSTLDHGRAYILRQLEAFGVKRVDISYEKLYYAPTADEWMRLLQFMDLSPSHNLTMKDVEEHFDYVSTNLPMRNLTLANYNEIAKALEGTKWEKLLIPVSEEAMN